MAKIELSNDLQPPETTTSPDRGSIIRSNMRLHWEDVLFGLLLLLTAIFYTYKLNQPDIGAIEYDEGLKMMIARVVSQGYPLYSSVFTDNSPLYIGILASCIRIFGTDPVFCRAAMVVFGLLGIVGVYALGCEISSRRIGLLSALFLALSYRWFEFSRLVMEEIPSATLQVFTLLVFLKCLKADQEQRETRWAMLTGVFLTASALMKTFSSLNFFLIVPILAYFKRHRKILIAFFIGWAIPLLVFLPLDIEAAFTQIVLHPLNRPNKTNLGLNWDILRTFFWPFWPYNSEDRILIASWPEGNVSALAIMGIFVALLSKRQDQMIVVLWTIFQGAYLLVWTSLYFHHVVLMLPFIPVLASLSTSKIKDAYVFTRDFIRNRLISQSDGIQTSRRIRNAPKRQVITFVIISTFLIVEMVLLVGYTVHPERIIEKDLILTSPRHGWGPNHPVGESEWRELISLIQAYSGPNDWIISDLPNLIYLADRIIVPELCDVTFMRIASGFLTAEYAIEMAEKYNVTLIVFWTRKLTTLGEFVDYVNSNYTPIWFDEPNEQIFVREIA